METREDRIAAEGTLNFSKNGNNIRSAAALVVLTTVDGIAGYEPELHGCSICGKELPKEPILCLEDGGICCRSCRKASMGSGAELDDASLAAFRFVLAAPARQMLSFRLEGRSLSLFAEAAERYLLLHAERGFSTLDYWKKIKR